MNHQDRDDFVFEFKRNAPPGQQGGQNRFQGDRDMKIAPPRSGLGGQPPRWQPPDRDQPEEEPEFPKKRRKKESKLSRFTKSFVLICIYVGIAVFLAYFALMSASDLLGLGQEDKQIQVVIPDSAQGSLHKVADILDEAGVISEKLTFTLYATLKGKGENFNAGTYVLNNKWGYDQIMRYISRDTASQDIVTITFPEGMTQRQIGELLEENQVVESAEDFHNALATASFDYEFVEMMPDSDLRYRKFEGYLFPDTYEFYTNMNPEEVAKKFFNNFQSKVDDELMAKIKNSDLGTLDQTIILASLIQKEANSLEEMKNVSAVFHNRLNDQATYPNLQSDTTDDYIQDSIIYFMNQKQQPVIDAYDTSKVRGLPAGPICNPGMEAILAALEPSEIDATFFVSDNANTYYYATTDAQHEANRQKAAQVNAQLRKEAEAMEETGQ